MYNRFKNAVNNAGIDVTVSNGEKNIASGNAVIYPVRSSSAEYDGRNNIYEGVSEPERYEMFCNSELLKDAEHGSIITVGENKYILLWKDDFSCIKGSYTKAYLKKLVDKG